MNCAVIGKEFGRGVALLVAKDDFDVALRQLAQERGGKRNRRALHDERIDLADMDPSFPFAAHDEAVQTKFELSAGLDDHDAKSHVIPFAPDGAIRKATGV